jgi:hypothetical protein
MSDTFMEHLPTLRDNYEDFSVLDFVPEQERSAEKEIDYFDIALHHPAPNTETLLSTEEMADIRRQPTEDVTNHFLTTLILRLAGDETAVSEFQEYHSIKNLNASLQGRQDVTSKKLESTQQHLEEITAIASPYLEMYGRVLRYAEIVEAVRMGDSPYTMSQFFGEIYDRTEHLEHPAIKFIREHQQELRETSIEAERLFRLMLVNPDL